MDPKAAQKTPTVVEELVPKVTKLDQDGDPVSSKEQVVVGFPRYDVETIAWAKWLSTQAMAQKISNAKHLAASSFFLS